MIHALRNPKSQAPNYKQISTVLAPRFTSCQGAGRKFQYSMTETGLNPSSSRCLEFGILVIVICLLFVIWNLVLSVLGHICDLG
jgi:hypothetical protein